MKISIIIPVYNQDVQLLTCCFLSAINQRLIDKDIVIVDDGSDDNCVEQALNNIFDDDPKKDNGNDYTIRIIQKTNGGVADALNTGIENAKYDYISWLSSDDYFYPEKSFIQINNMVSSDTMFSFCGFREISNRCGKIIMMKDYPTNYHTGIIRGSVVHRDLLKNFPSSFINGASVVMHKKIIDDVGNFKDMKYLQDYEMWLRITRKYDVCACKDVMMVKNIHENQMMYIYGEDHFRKHRAAEETEVRALYL